MDQDNGPRKSSRTGIIGTPDRVLRSTTKRSPGDLLESSVLTRARRRHGATEPLETKDQENGPKKRSRTGTFGTPDRVLRSATKRSSDETLERSLLTPRARHSRAASEPVETKTPKVRPLQLTEDSCTPSTPTRRLTRRSATVSPQTPAGPTPTKKTRTSISNKTPVTKAKAIFVVKPDNKTPQQKDTSKNDETLSLDGYESADSGIKEMEESGYKGTGLSPISETSPIKECTTNIDHPLFKIEQTTPPTDQMKQSKRKSSSNEKTVTSVKILPSSSEKKKENELEVGPAVPLLSFGSSSKRESNSPEKIESHRTPTLVASQAPQEHSDTRQTTYDCENDVTNKDKDDSHDSSLVLTYTSEEESETIIPSTTPKSTADVKKNISPLKRKSLEKHREQITPSAKSPRKEMRQGRLFNLEGESKGDTPTKPSSSLKAKQFPDQLFSAEKEITLFDSSPVIKSKKSLPISEHLISTISNGSLISRGGKGSAIVSVYSVRPAEETRVAEALLQCNTTEASEPNGTNLQGIEENCNSNTFEKPSNSISCNSECLKREKISYLKPPGSIMKVTSPSNKLSSSTGSAEDIGDRSPYIAVLDSESSEEGNSSVHTFENLIKSKAKRDKEIMEHESKFEGESSSKIICTDHSPSIQPSDDNSMTEKEDECKKSSPFNPDNTKENDAMCASSVNVPVRICESEIELERQSAVDAVVNQSMHPEPSHNESLPTNDETNERITSQTQQNKSSGQVEKETESSSSCNQLPLDKMDNPAQSLLAHTENSCTGPSPLKSVGKSSKISKDRNEFNKEEEMIARGKVGRILHEPLKRDEESFIEDKKSFTLHGKDSGNDSDDLSNESEITCVLDKQTKSPKLSENVKSARDMDYLAGKEKENNQKELVSVTCEHEILPSSKNIQDSELPVEDLIDRKSKIGEMGNVQDSDESCDLTKFAMPAEELENTSSVENVVTLDKNEKKELAVHKECDTSAHKILRTSEKISRNVLSSPEKDITDETKGGKYVYGSAEGSAVQNKLRKSATIKEQSRSSRDYINNEDKERKEEENSEDPDDESINNNVRKINESLKLSVKALSDKHVIDVEAEEDAGKESCVDQNDISSSSVQKINESLKMPEKDISVEHVSDNEAEVEEEENSNDQDDQSSNNIAQKKNESGQISGKFLPEKHVINDETEEEENSDDQDDQSSDIIAQKKNESGQISGKFLPEKHVINDETEEDEEEEEGNSDDQDAEFRNNNVPKRIESLKMSGKVLSEKHVIDDEAEEDEEEENNDQLNNSSNNSMKERNESLEMPGKDIFSKHVINDEVEGGDEDMSVDDSTEHNTAQKCLLMKSVNISGKFSSTKIVVDDKNDKAEGEGNSDCQDVSSDNSINKEQTSTKMTRKSFSTKDFIDDEAEEGEEEENSDDEDGSSESSEQKKHFKSGKAICGAGFIDDETEEEEEAENSDVEEDSSEFSAPKTNVKSAKLSGNTFTVVKDFIDDEAEEGEEEENSDEEDYSSEFSAPEKHGKSAQESGNTFSDEDLIVDEAEEEVVESSDEEDDSSEFSAPNKNMKSLKKSGNFTVKDFIDDEAEEGEEDEISDEEDNSSECSAPKKHSKSAKLSGNTFSVKDFINDETEEGEDEYSEEDDSSEFKVPNKQVKNHSSDVDEGSIQSTDGEIDDRSNHKFGEFEISSSTRETDNNFTAMQIDDCSKGVKDEESSDDSEGGDGQRKLAKSVKRLDNISSADDFIDDMAEGVGEEEESSDDGINQETEEDNDPDELGAQKRPIFTAKAKNICKSVRSANKSEMPADKSDFEGKIGKSRRQNYVKRRTVESSNSELSSSFVDVESEDEDRHLNNESLPTKIKKTANNSETLSTRPKNSGKPIREKEKKLKGTSKEPFKVKKSSKHIPKLNPEITSDDDLIVREPIITSGESLKILESKNVKTKLRSQPCFIIDNESKLETTERNQESHVQDHCGNNWFVSVDLNLKKKRSTEENLPVKPDKKVRNLPPVDGCTKERKNPPSKKHTKTDVTKISAPCPKLDVENKENSKGSQKEEEKKFHVSNKTRSTFPSQESLTCSDQSSDPLVMARVYNLKSITARELRDLFNKHGIKELEAIHLNACPPTFFTKGKGYGTVMFSTEKELIRAVDLRPLMFWQGLALRLEPDPSFNPVTRAAKEWLFQNFKTAQNSKVARPIKKHMKN